MRDRVLCTNMRGQLLMNAGKHVLQEIASQSQLIFYICTCDLYWLLILCRMERISMKVWEQVKNAYLIKVYIRKLTLNTLNTLSWLVFLSPSHFTHCTHVHTLNIHARTHTHTHKHTHTHPHPPTHPHTVIVEKDNSQNWDPPTLAEVTPAMVARYFAPLTSQSELKLD